jgi:LSD1 subclass zinc finger protein
MNFTEKTAELHRIKCKDCGAFLSYKVGTTQLSCAYCGTSNEIEANKSNIVELDFNSYLEAVQNSPSSQKIQTVKCTDCGASTNLKEGIVSDRCPYCATPIVVSQSSTFSVITPSSILPFKIKKEEADVSFKKWVNGLWFAPSDLKVYANSSKEELKAVYIPYWTYDCDTYTHYLGERGEHYSVQENYQDANGNTQTRSVQKTSWENVEGEISQNFDDLLVCASSGLPKDITKSLEPWDLQELMDYNDSFLSGFITESYALDLAQGWNEAKEEIKSKITSLIKDDIGGDEQRITSVDLQHSSVTFKHILLPLYLNSFKFNNKPYRFLINARTGEVQGERPYSFWKIFFFVVSIISVIVLGVFALVKST